MNRYWMAALSIVVLGLLAGCPFSSKVPIADPGGIPLDGRLFGLWAGTSVQEGDSISILVLPFNEGEYYVELREKGDLTTRMRAFPFVASGAPFLQLNDLTSDPYPASFSFCRCTLSEAGELAIRFVSEEYVPDSLASNPKGLVDFLGAHAENPLLDDGNSRATLRRVDR